MKNFDEWNTKKKIVNFTEHAFRIFFREREVWWCHLGVNVGFEQDEKGEDFRRPILILKKFSENSIWGVPLSTTTKRGAYYMPIGHVNGEDAVALISQIRFIDTRRLVHKTGVVDKEIFSIIRKTIRELIP